MKNEEVPATSFQDVYFKFFFKIKITVFNFDFCLQPSAEKNASADIYLSIDLLKVYVKNRFTTMLLTSLNGNIIVEFFVQEI